MPPLLIRAHLDPAEVESTVFRSAMEEFRGYPEQLTYEDKPGHVVYVNSPKSRKYDRREGAEYLELLHERDKQRIRIVRTVESACGPDGSSLRRPPIGRTLWRSSGNGTIEEAVETERKRVSLMNGRSVWMAVR